MRDKIKPSIFLWLFVMLSVMCSVNAFAAEAVDDICFFRTQNGIYAKAYKKEAAASPIKLIVAVYENDILKSADIKSSTENEIVSEELVLSSSDEAVKAFAVIEDFSPVSKVYTPYKAAADFAVTAKVYGSEYKGKINPRNHTITFDVPKTLAEDLNSAAYREEKGYLPIGNFHFDTNYTLKLTGAAASYDGKTVLDDTAFPVGGDCLISVTDTNGKTEDYTVEVNISEAAYKSGSNQAGFPASVVKAESPDKLTAVWTLNVKSGSDNSDLFSIGSNDLPITTIVTTKGQKDGYFSLKIRKNNEGIYCVPVTETAFAMNENHEISYIFRKSNSGGICELYADNRFITVIYCTEAEIQSIGSAEEGSVFYTEDTDGAEYSADITGFNESIVRSRPELYAEKLPGGKNAAYTFTGDDGFVNSAKWYYNTFKELGIRGSLALNSSKTDAESLRPYVSDGILDIGNHGKTHKILTGLDDAVLEDEVSNGQKELREMFEGSSVLTMYLPNNQRNDKVMEKLKETHYAVRCTGSNQSNSLYLGRNGLYNTSFYSVLSATDTNAGTDYARLKWRFDDARSRGRWIVEMWHEVSGDDVDGTPNLKAPYVYDSAEAKKYFTYVASHSDEVYCGGYETLVKYILERDYLRVKQLSFTGDKITYSAEYDKSMLIKDTDAAYFNMPLTLNTVVPDNWVKASVTQDGKETICQVYKEQSAVLGAKERNYILFDAIPNGSEITIKSVPEDYVVLGDEAEITAAKVQIGGNTYSATINTEQHIITFAVPYAGLKSELTDAASGKKSPAIMPDMSAVQISLTAKGKLTADGKGVSNSFVADADSLKEISAEAKDKKISYQVRFIPMLVAGRYNCNGAELTSTTEAQASRRGVPKSLSNGNASSGNFGDGLWRINQSGMAYNDDGAVDDTNTYASLSIAARADDTNNQYIRLNKYKSTRGTNAKVWLYRQSNYGNNSNAVRTKLKFNLFSFTKNNSGMLYLWSSDADQIVLSSQGMADNKFKLCHRGTNTDAMTDFSNSPVLETNAWYTLITEFYCSEESENGYYMDVFLQKENEDIEYLGRISNQKSCPTGVIAYPKNEFMLQAWSDAIFDIGIDDYEVMTVESNEKYDTTVHLLGDSICRYYDTEKLAPQQGWGPYMRSMLDEHVRVLNYSVGGYNTNIYLNGAKRSNLTSPPIIPSLCRTLNKGDYVVVALGWNEANTVDGSWNTESFKSNLKRIADACKEKEAEVIFITSTPNLKSDYSGLANSCLTGLGHSTEGGEREYVYPVTDMKNFASENGYVCLDLNTAMYERLVNMSSDEYKEIFTGTSSVTPNNSINKDYLHITEKGAELAGELIKTLLKESTSPLKEYLKEG